MTEGPSQRTRSSRSWPWRRVLIVLALVIGTAVAVQVLSNSSDELYTAADQLTNLQVGWVVAAFGAEAVCYLSRGAAQRRLLVSGASSTRPPAEVGRAGSVVLAATTIAGDAVAYCLPFGFAAAGVVTLRVLRRRGIDEVLAGWMFAVGTLLYTAVLAVLGIVAAQLAGNDGPVPGLQEVSTILLAALLTAIAVVLAIRHWPSTATTLWPRRLRPRGIRGNPTDTDSGRAFVLLHRTRRAAVEHLTSWWAQLRRLRLSPTALAAATALTLISWVCDIAVLGASYAAIGAVPPWTGLLLAYCAGQIASSVPITPGGIGVVEGSLTLALVAFGGSTATALAAVLVYRLISHWSCIPVGGIAWLALRLNARTPIRAAVPASGRMSVCTPAVDGDPI